MIQFNKVKLSPQIIDQWVNAGVNVLLIGEKGVGKTAQILDAFKRNNLKYSYFSGATLDPWIHLLGIPKAKVGEDGKEKMDFILPENLDENVEAIFCDEWNRTNKIVRNALLELQQFKSINGRKFPNLKLVWGAINPPATDDTDDVSYDVEELDPAQLDRFHVIVELPNEPDTHYFRTKFGNYYGDILVKWWKEQSKESKKILSPRRLDYIGECFKKGLNIKFLLPVSANHTDLISKLSIDEGQDYLKRILDEDREDEIKDFLRKDDNFLNNKSKFQTEERWKYWKYIKPEFVIDEIKNNIKFADYATYQGLKNDGFYREQLLSIAKATPTHEVIKCLKVLKAQNYKLSKEDDTIDNFIPKKPLFEFIDYMDYEANKNTQSINNIIEYQSLTNTFDYKKVAAFSTTAKVAMMSELWKCIYDLPFNKVASIVLGCIDENSTNQPANLSKYIGTLCILAKNKKLKIKEISERLSSINNKAISSHRKKEWLDYLNNQNKYLYSPVPESFQKVMRDIRDVVRQAATPDNQWNTPKN